MDVEVIFSRQTREDSCSLRSYDMEVTLFPGFWTCSFLLPGHWYFLVTVGQNVKCYFNWLAKQIPALSSWEHQSTHSKSGYTVYSNSLCITTLHKILWCKTTGSDTWDWLVISKSHLLAEEMLDIFLALGGLPDYWGYLQVFLLFRLVASLGNHHLYIGNSLTVWKRSKR